MQAVVMRDGALVVDEFDLKPPQPGQVLVEVLACGICGSDLHTLRHGDAMVEMSELAAAADPISARIMDISHDVVMGHEFAARVLDVGENVGNAKPDDIVVSMPIVMDSGGVHAIGFSNDYPGGYAEQMMLTDLLTLKVPNGLDPRHAALTEPMAVGLHAVESSRITPAHAAVVLGCGPVGLAVVAALHLAGVEVIVAADFSPTRRRLASTVGATDVVDPRDIGAVEHWRAVDGRRPLVVFEAIGVPGILDQAMLDAPRQSQILVVGACMEPDTIRPMLGLGKELNIQFVFGYDPMQFGRTLTRIAEGELDVSPLITGEVDLDGVAQAFEDLGDPDAHAKILVIPA